jgi:hypothetical protein
MEGLSGTLHLENYDKTAINPYYSFLPDAEEEEETQEFSQEETEE